ncbi:hypothetical protein F0L16_14700 [Photorhabdus heterorhabditis]|uniref:Uncharacterized protein n=1 Tax=Photorhabdus heterorhabditis TaxID=880156 RepID=A0A5B0WFS7_9GAMM|nr:hypothetical protein F0L16_14700 [Photorhabdus heterorhabditis]KOY60065.1 hypothetical protein AM629_21460 [Photorhabdus heterorhabditis]
MKVIITGAAGFLGQQLASALLKNNQNLNFDQVTAPRRKKRRGFPLLRPQPLVQRIYAGLRGQKRRVPPPVILLCPCPGC